MEGPGPPSVNLMLILQHCTKPSQPVGQRQKNLVPSFSCPKTKGLHSTTSRSKKRVMMAKTHPQRHCLGIPPNWSRPARPRQPRLLPTQQAAKRAPRTGTSSLWARRRMTINLLAPMTCSRCFIKTRLQTSEGPCKRAFSSLTARH